MIEVEQVIEKLDSLREFISSMPMSVENSSILSAIIEELETKPNKSFCKRVLANCD